MTIEKLENYIDGELRKLKLLEDSKEIVAAIKDSKRIKQEADLAAAAAQKNKDDILSSIEVEVAALTAKKDKILFDISEADGKADRIVSDANSKAKEIIAQAEEKAALSSLKKDIASAKETLAEINIAISEKTKDLTKVKSDWAEIQAKMKSLVGA